MDRQHRSIGEVLTLLKQEFPDITISKIRFLESQDLIKPERTPSGYRKFYDEDIERLSWVLQQQRENYLPLKVIRDKLEAVDDPSNRAQDEQGAQSLRAVTPEPPAQQASQVTQQAQPAGYAQVEQPKQFSARQNTRDGQKTHQPVPAGSLTRDQLIDGSSLSRDKITELERSGMLPGETINGAMHFSGAAEAVIRLAEEFARYGIEPRHLRQYKHAADREQGLIEQVIAPMLRQRTPASKHAARDAIEELTKLGAELHDLMLTKGFAKYFSD